MLLITMDDTFIQNATPTEKLCFMILDQMKRMEDHIDTLYTKIDQLKHDSEYFKRWTKFAHFERDTPYGRKQRIFRIIQSVDPYWLERLFSEHCSHEIVCLLIDWIHVEKLDFATFEKRFLERWDTMPDEDVILAIWGKLPMEEIDKIIY